MRVAVLSLSEGYATLARGLVTELRARALIAWRPGVDASESGPADVVLAVGATGGDEAALRRGTAIVPTVAIVVPGHLRDLSASLGGAMELMELPPDADELAARIRGRRAPAFGPTTISFGGRELVVCIDRRAVSVNGTTLNLTARQTDLICLLASAEGAWVTTEELAEEVFGTPAHESSKLRVHICRIRRRFGTAARFLETRAGFGARLHDPNPIGSGP